MCKCWRGDLFRTRSVLRFNDSRGSVTVLIVAVLPVLLLLMGWSIDVGRVLAVKTELYKAGDIAAREMAKRIDMEAASADGRQERELSEAKARELVENNLDGLSGAKLTDVQVIESGVNIKISCAAEVPLLFCGIIGRKSEKVSATGLGRIKILRAYDR